MKSFNKKLVIPLASLVIVLSVAGVAYAATNDSSTTTAGGTATSNVTTVTPRGDGPAWQRDAETALTGDVLAKVKAAALAKIGSDATVTRVETDADGNAKYEVHAIKADGTGVIVYVDSSYKVVSVATGVACGNGSGRGYGMMGGRGGSAETALTGDTLAKVKAAALAAGGSGATFMWASTEGDNSNSAVKYQAEVRKADGTCLVTYLDSSFNVVSTQTGPQGGMYRGGGRGPGRCMGGSAVTNGAGGASNGASWSNSI